MIERLKNELRKDGIIFTKFEKIGDESYIISEDEKIKIKASKFKNFEIKCSECGNWYTIKTFVYRYKDKKYLCNICNHLGERNPMYGKHPTEETKKKLSERSKGPNNYWYGKHHTEEVKVKISKANKGRLVGEKNPMYGINVYEKLEKEKGTEYVKSIKKKISESTKGEKNGFYGKHHTEETKEKLSKSLKNSEKFRQAVSSEENRQKIKDGLKNSEKFKKEVERRRTAEYREEKRLQRMKQVELAISPSPAFNQKACKVFDIISEEQGIHIQHAMNSGEFCVKELGFYLDGYDAENNVAYEYDESHHFVGGELREEDAIRQKRIEEVLHCTFIRLRDEDYDDDGHKIIKEEEIIIVEEESNNGTDKNNE